MHIKMTEKAKELGLGLPCYATEGSAAFDLCACIEYPVTLLPDGGYTAIATGLSLQIPAGYAGLMFIRSGLAFKHGLGLVNGVGVIDADYRGEVICGVRNYGREGYTIQPGERIAQLAIVPVNHLPMVAADRLDETERGEGGFGSTGKK